MRPPRILFLLCCALVAGSAAPGARSADDPYSALLAPAGVCGAAADQLSLERAAAEQAMTCLTNYARSQSGLAPLRPNALLGDAGRAKLAADLSCAEFSHTPCGAPFTDVFKAYVDGATTYALGENIAWGTGSYGTPRQTMSGWLHSTGHRENILSADYRELGIGYLAHQTFQGYSGASLWSQEFGARTPAASSTPQPANAPAAGVPAAKKPVPKRKHRPRKVRHLQR